MLIYSDKGKSLTVFDTENCSYTMVLEKPPEAIRVICWVCSSEEKEYREAFALFQPQADLKMLMRHWRYWRNHLIESVDIWLKATEHWKELYVFTGDMESWGIKWGARASLTSEGAPITLIATLKLGGLTESGAVEFEVKCPGVDGWLNDLGNTWSLVDYEYVRATQTRQVCQTVVTLGDTWRADESTMRRYRREMLL